MKQQTVVAAMVLLCLATTAYADQDFFGISFKSEAWVKAMMGQDPQAANPKDLLNGPVLNQQIRAEASLREVADGRLDFRVTILNGTSELIPTDFESRDFFITTRDGRRYPLIDENDDMDLEIIGANSKQTFSPSLGNLKIRNKDVVLIECSFNLGRTKVFLFPWEFKEKVVSLTSPVASEDMLNRNAKKSGQFLGGLFSERQQSDRSPNDRALNDRRLSKEASQRLEETVKNFKYVPSDKTTRQAAKSADTDYQEPSKNISAKRDGRDFADKQGLDSAIKNFVYKPAQATSLPENKPLPKNMENEAKNFNVVGRSSARVIGVNKEFSFVTLDLGIKDGLKKDAFINIIRNGKIIATARVKQLRDAVCAAALIPPVGMEVVPGDLVSLV